MFYTYVLQSKKTGKRYIGFSNDLKRRFAEHNNGFVDSTIHGRPWKIVYYEACLNEEKAIQREKYFKTGFGRRFLGQRI